MKEKSFTVKLDLVKAKHEHDAGECDSWCGWCYQESIKMEKLAHEGDGGMSTRVIDLTGLYEGQDIHEGEGSKSIEEEGLIRAEMADLEADLLNEHDKESALATAQDEYNKIKEERKQHYRSMYWNYPGCHTPGKRRISYNNWILTKGIEPERDK